MLRLSPGRQAGKPKGQRTARRGKLPAWIQGSWKTGSWDSATARQIVAVTDFSARGFESCFPQTPTPAMKTQNSSITPPKMPHGSLQSAPLSALAPGNHCLLFVLSQLRLHFTSVDSPGVLDAPTCTLLAHCWRRLLRATA